MNTPAPVHSIYADTETLIFPNAITLKILLSGSQTDGTLAIFEDIVEPGVGPGRHIHHQQDETFFFLEGQFIAEVGGELFECKPGDIVFIPKGIVHAFKNVGNESAKLRYAFSPAQTTEEMFRAFYRKSTEGNLSMDEMAAISAQHGQEFVGPPL